MRPARRRRGCRHRPGTTRGSATRSSGSGRPRPAPYWVSKRNREVVAVGQREERRAPPPPGPGEPERLARRGRPQRRAGRRRARAPRSPERRGVERCTARVVRCDPVTLSAAPAGRHGPLVPSGGTLWRCSWFSPPPRRAATRRSAACSPRSLDNVEHVIQGKREQVHLALVCLLAEGHLLIEDVPGVGKTSLAKAIARSIGGTWHRIQFTPDLLPSDVTGVSVWNRGTDEFEFRPGGVFANVVLADEINRASPKTQSALLEAMEERQVTVDAHTYPLPAPVHGDRDPEPDRARGHLPAARGAARPVPHAHPDGLPEPRRRARDPRGAGRTVARPPTSSRPVVERRPTSPRPRRGRHACTSRPSCAATCSTSSTRRAATPTSCSARARAGRSRCSAPRARSPRASGASTSSPTTSSAWCPRCSSTGAARARRPAARRRRRATSCDAILASVPVAGRDRRLTGTLATPGPSIAARRVTTSPGAAGRSIGAALGLVVGSFLLGAVELLVLGVAAARAARRRSRVLARGSRTRPDLAVQPAGRARPPPRRGRRPHRPHWSRTSARAPRPCSSPPTGSTRAAAPPASSCRRSQPGATARAAYRIPTRRRGRYRVGPLVARGHRSVRPRPARPCRASAKPSVLGAARVSTTSSRRSRSAAASAGETRGRRGARAIVSDLGDEFLTLRDYELGDDLRRVHWRSTARTGELMIRQDEARWRSRAAVVLDVHPDGHDAESFEVAVEAAASVVARLVRLQRRVEVVTSAGEVLGTGGDPRHDVIDRPRHRRPRRPPTGSPPCSRTSRTHRRVDLVVAVLGRVGARHVHALGSLAGIDVDRRAHAAGRAHRHAVARRRRRVDHSRSPTAWNQALTRPSSTSGGSAHASSHRSPSPR